MPAADAHPHFVIDGTMSELTRLPAEPTLELRAHAEQVGASVRSTLEAVVLAISGPRPRPSHLISRVGLDKTLAGRIIQTVSTSEALAALARSPSPAGLSIFLQAAQNAGVAPATILQARSAVTRYEELLSRFPRGRSDLEAALSGWMPETREQGERSARQAAFKSMSFLLGYQSEVTLVCTLLRPSASPGAVDVAYMSGQFGLRRLRVGEPLSVFGIRYYPLVESGVLNPNPRTLDGRSLDEASCLLDDFCAPGPPKLDVVKTRDQRLFVLPPNEPIVNEPVSIVVGHINVGGWKRYAADDRREEWQTMLTRCPTRVAVCDAFIHEDVYPNVEPVVTTHIAGMSPLPARERGPGFPLDEVHLSKETGWVNSDLTNIGTGEIPRYPELVASLFARLGEDPRKYRTHRLRMNYPVAGIVATRWFKLPDPPRPGA